MSTGDLLALDIDTLRFVLVASVVAAAVIYTRLGLSTAGTLSAAYVVLLLLQGRTDALAGLVAVTAVSYLSVRVVLTRRLALPVDWLFVAFVAVSAAATSALLLLFRSTGPIGLPGDAELLIVVGAFVTPGLMAYDLFRQGVATTAAGFGAALATTLLLTVPVLAVANAVAPDSSTLFVETTGAIPPGLGWLAALSAVLLSSALRLGPHVRAAGFLGAVFLAEFLSVAAFVTVITAAVVASLLTDRFAAVVVLTPRQRFHVSLLLGALAAWTGLYWGARIGWTPAQEANRYALEPLLAVGLLAADMGRTPGRMWQPILGLTGATAFVAAVLALADTTSVAGPLVAALLLVVVPVAVAVPATRRLRRSWRLALDLGNDVAPPAGRLPGAPVPCGRGEPSDQTTLQH